MNYDVKMSMVFSADVSVSIPPRATVSEGDLMIQVCVALFAVDDTERNFNLTLATSSGTGIILQQALGMHFVNNYS